MLWASDHPGAHLERDPNLVRVAHGAYYVPPFSDMPMWRWYRDLTLARAMAATRNFPSAMGVMGEAAAMFHGLSATRFEPDIDIATPVDMHHGKVRLPRIVKGRSRGKQVYIRRRVRAPLDDAWTVINGIPVTTLRRTAIDCALLLPPHESLPIVDSALRAIIRPDFRSGFARVRADQRAEAIRTELLTSLAQMGRRRGSRRARAVLALADPFAESPGESVLRWAAAASGLPIPRTQHEFTGNLQRYFVDLAYPEWRVAWEFDGLKKYSQESDLHAEKLRQQRLEREGWKVHRFVWEELRDLDQLRMRLRNTLPPRALASHISRPDLL